jgi:hypothetical protein
MSKDSVVFELCIEKIREWVRVVNPYFVAVRPPEFFEDMGFPPRIVRQCIRMHRHIRLNNGDFGDARGVSDGVILRVLAEGIGADCSQGDKMLCNSNKIQAWRDACIARLDELERDEHADCQEEVKSR